MGHDGIQEEILRKLEDSSTQRQIDIGGGVLVNITQEDYGESDWAFWDWVAPPFVPKCVYYGFL